MKKIISAIAITALLFACSKTETTLPSDEGQVLDESFEKSMTVITNEAILVTSATATCGGEIKTSGGGGNVVERGICYNTSPHPKITDFTVPSGSGNGSFTAILTGLDGSTTYYARAYAIKSNGTVKYGNQVTFTTLTDYGTVTDADGNVYTTININNQVWTVENLKTTKYRDGTLIPNVTDDTLWATQTTGAYCDFHNQDSTADTYGRLYNWYAVNDSRNIAPEGWHVANRYEVKALIDYLGCGWYWAGGKLKETGFSHWKRPNAYADNSTGFSARSGGSRMADPYLLTSHFRLKKSEGRFWCAYSPGGDAADYFFMQSDSPAVWSSFTAESGGPGYYPYNKCNGYHVRLVKD